MDVKEFQLLVNYLLDIEAKTLCQRTLEDLPQIVSTTETEKVRVVQAQLSVLGARTELDRHNIGQLREMNAHRFFGPEWFEELRSKLEWLQHADGEKGLAFGRSISSRRQYIYALRNAKESLDNLYHPSSRADVDLDWIRIWINRLVVLEAATGISAKWEEFTDYLTYGTRDFDKLGHGHIDKRFDELFDDALRTTNEVLSSFGPRETQLLSDFDLSDYITNDPAAVLANSQRGNWYDHAADYRMQRQQNITYLSILKASLETIFSVSSDDFVGPVDRQALEQQVGYSKRFRVDAAANVIDEDNSSPTQIDTSVRRRRLHGDLCRHADNLLSRLKGDNQHQELYNPVAAFRAACSNEVRNLDADFFLLRGYELRDHITANEKRDKRPSLHEPWSEEIERDVITLGRLFDYFVATDPVLDNLSKQTVDALQRHGAVLPLLSAMTLDFAAVEPFLTSRGKQALNALNSQPAEGKDNPALATVVRLEGRKNFARSAIDWLIAKTEGLGQLGGRALKTTTVAISGALILKGLQTVGESLLQWTSVNATTLKTIFGGSPTMVQAIEYIEALAKLIL